MRSMKIAWDCHCSCKSSAAANLLHDLPNYLAIPLRLAFNNSRAFSNGETCRKSETLTGMAFEMYAASDWQSHSSYWTDQCEFYYPKAETLQRERFTIHYFVKASCSAAGSPPFPLASCPRNLPLLHRLRVLKCCSYSSAPAQHLCLAHRNSPAPKMIPSCVL